MDIQQKNITLIGSGNVATHFAIALKKAGFNILEVFSTHAENAHLLAKKVDAEIADNLSELNPEADLFLLSVNDSAYEGILEEFPFKNKLMVHTAGSLSMEILSGTSTNFGVIYPFQTLSKNKEINFGEVPLLYCASNTETGKILKNIAEKISDNVRFSTDLQRKYIHISAVFACNFTNLMYVMAKSITEQHNIDFALLYPLIKETAEKVQLGDPKDMQTGPAVRNDQNIIQSHLALLENNPEMQHIYKILTDSIIKHQSKNGEEL